MWKEARRERGMFVPFPGGRGKLICASQICSQHKRAGLTSLVVLLFLDLGLFGLYIRLGTQQHGNPVGLLFAFQRDF